MVQSNQGQLKGFKCLSKGGTGVFWLTMVLVEIGFQEIPRNIPPDACFQILFNFVEADHLNVKN